MDRDDRLKLRLLVGRLRATDDPQSQAFADELEGVIEADPAELLLKELQRDARRPRGRPTDPPLRRLNKLMRAGALSDALYAGELKASELPPDYEDIANGCVGDRSQADEVAGELLEVSARTVRRYRRREWTDADIEALIESSPWPWPGDDEADQWPRSDSDDASDDASDDLAPWPSAFDEDDAAD